LAVLIVVAFWWQPWAPAVEPAPVEAITVPRTDIPSIAVLPFDNISGDPEQEYFADGMAEDLITDLSKLSALFVVPGDSSFRYKGRDLDIEQIGRELERIPFIPGHILRR
jgi:adenylate cyclase